jgi:hypothetical protein
MKQQNISMGILLAGYIANIVIFQSIPLLLLPNLKNVVDFFNSWSKFQVCYATLGHLRLKAIDCAFCSSNHLRKLLHAVKS